MPHARGVPCSAIHAHDAIDFSISQFKKWLQWSRVLFDGFLVRILSKWINGDTIDFESRIFARETLEFGSGKFPKGNLKSGSGCGGRSWVSYRPLALLEWVCRNAQGLIFFAACVSQRGGGERGSAAIGGVGREHALGEGLCARVSQPLSPAHYLPPHSPQP